VDDPFFNGLVAVSRILAELQIARGKLLIDDRLIVAEVLRNNYMPTIAGALVNGVDTRGETLPFDAEFDRPSEPT
jgi:hypothetical protein